MRFLAKGGNSPSPPGSPGSTSQASFGKQIDEMWYAPLFVGGALLGGTVATTTAVVVTTLAPGHVYLFTSNQDAWITQGTTTSPPTAVKGAGSCFVAKGQQILLDGSQGAQLAAIADSSAGLCSVVEVTV